jgi:hypothetical protein
MAFTGEEIRVRGLAALKKELGRAGLARFLQHYERRAGNYTEQRRELLKDLTMSDLRQRVRKPKRRSKPRRP